MQSINKIVNESVSKLSNDNCNLGKQVLMNPIIQKHTGKLQFKNIKTKNGMKKFLYNNVCVNFEEIKELMVSRSMYQKRYLSKLASTNNYEFLQVSWINYKNFLSCNSTTFLKNLELREKIELRMLKSLKNDNNGIFILNALNIYFEKCRNCNNYYEDMYFNCKLDLSNSTLNNVVGRDIFRLLNCVINFLDEKINNKSKKCLCCNIEENDNKLLSILLKSFFLINFNQTILIHEVRYTAVLIKILAEEELNENEKYIISSIERWINNSKHLDQVKLTRIYSIQDIEFTS